MRRAEPERKVQYLLHELTLRLWRCDPFWRPFLRLLLFGWMQFEYPDSRRAVMRLCEHRLRELCELGKPSAQLADAVERVKQWRAFLTCRLGKGGVVYALTTKALGKKSLQ